MSFSSSSALHAPFFNPFSAVGTGDFLPITDMYRDVQYKYSSDPEKQYWGRNISIYRTSIPMLSKSQTFGCIKFLPVFMNCFLNDIIRQKNAILYYYLSTGVRYNWLCFFLSTYVVYSEKWELINLIIKSQYNILTFIYSIIFDFDSNTEIMLLEPEIELTLPISIYFYLYHTLIPNNLSETYLIKYDGLDLFILNFFNKSLYPYS